MKKMNRKLFVANIYNGLPGHPNDPPPIAPITTIKEIASEIKRGENAGYFRVMPMSTLSRNDTKYIEEARWLVTMCAKDGLIDRKYTPRKKPISERK